MCGRINLRASPAELQQMFDLFREPEWSPRYNLGPIQRMLAIRLQPEGTRLAELLQWGLVPGWASDEHDVQPDESLITAHWSAAPASTQCLLGRLTHAELEVVLCMGRGLIRDDEIGRQLFRSPHTVRTQVASIFDKLGLHSRPELLGWLKRANGDVHAANGPQ